MQKRGESTLYFLFTILLPFFVLIIFMTVAVRVGSDEFFIQENVAQDFALAIETVDAAPGEVHYTFSRDVHEYVIDIKEGIVMVADAKTDSKGTAVKSSSSRSAHYVSRTGVDLTALITNPTRITLITTPLSIEHDGVAPE